MEEKKGYLNSHRYTSMLFGYITSENQPLAFLILSQDQPSEMPVTSSAVVSA